MLRATVSCSLWGYDKSASDDAEHQRQGTAGLWQRSRADTVAYCCKGKSVDDKSKIPKTSCLHHTSRCSI